MFLLKIVSEISSDVIKCIWFGVKIYRGIHVKVLSLMYFCSVQFDNMLLR